MILSTICFTASTSAQKNVIKDSIFKKDRSLSYESFIIPTTLITYGAVALNVSSVKDLDTPINQYIDGKEDSFPIDDVTQFLPSASVYVLNLFGVPGKHDFIDRTLILGSAYVLMGGSVRIIKNNTGIKRPDGYSNRSFPSGHTATAFMGAEFLYQEYRDVSIWYGVTGYAFAVSTAFLRLYNNKHWFSDVVAGAGIGILSTKIAYAIYPFLKRIFLKSKSTKALATPFYNGEHVGLAFTMSF
ncbi:phosphatase PAP2 family protein [Dokdonia sp. Hel_I_53]|uniref:phosphatase PAP2 family protein n=1 Tax=Dokdonia sp. Hel_I_53 TaxID=1566287 RepID=UPI00119BCCC1|nr:phosphatase PAP2 family protein [Dokdonia sp. Hel_I_53]TVZ52624.1 PAP2 superfamily protein [Dokdonia sp. Hel_I_53]